ncbi:ABC1 family protein MCP2 [Cyberlindnera fabianii]|uniref:ABC1 family protein MCP2 n=1 Tax=Cyberlindnera fabianii TaxID=36022 RepID=A0A1V2LCZ7_CYBFA|nr:ABC1 family protein MCP2 [Cyberlindnera fabianii]
MFSHTLKKTLVRNSTQRGLSTAFSSPRSSYSFRSHPKKYIFGGLFTAGALAYATNDEFHDGVRHTYLTLGRVSVVAGATVRCFWQYKRTLGKEYETNTEKHQAMSKCHKKCAEITLKALEKNGGIYIKLGQHISAMTYLFPPEWTSTMRPLEDKCPESSFEEIDEMFKHDWGHSIDELFAEFDKKPIGAASLAQVHIARLKNGEKVAVKCQHPSLKEFVPLDIFLTQTVFAALDRVFPEYPLVWLGEELQESIYVELDFRNEAKNARRTSEYFSNFQHNTALRVPNVIKSTNRILVMEFIGGERLDNTEFMDKNGINRSEVSACLSHTFNNMVFTPGVGVHCDPHGGNLAIRRKPADGNPSNPFNFEIILYDHGLYRDVPTELRTDYAKFWLAMIARDQETMKKYAKKFANIDDAQFPVLAAAITGRDINTALNYDIKKVRDDDEIERMKYALTEGELLTDLMIILSRVPRVVLLIMKTNDLTRHLDDVLKNPLGPERTFLILSKYAANAVYQDDLRKAMQESFWRRYVDILKAWCHYKEIAGKLYVYDFVMWIKNWFTRV